MCSTRRKNIATIILALVCAFSYAQDDLNVFSGKNKWLHHTDASNALYHHLANEAYGHLDQRAKLIAGYSSRSEWMERQQFIKETLHKAVGPFPEKTPLNAKVVRIVKKDFYRVEHIVYESQPQFFVTASLFIPSGIKKRDKAPVIIYCSGHNPSGYRSTVYQRVILNLVKKGFMVFAFDPVGQGERLEYYNPETKKSLVGGPTIEHSYPGSQAFITGSSQARYMIWDGIRAVDYLLTRKDVDPKRIGITGRSGGGTQSSYIAAFDERIHAAAPECYITTFTRLLQSMGPQDAEQNFPGGISSGLDQGDLLLVRAPKPALMITTTRDIFSIQGARETAAEVSRAYRAQGAEDNFHMVEDDAPHESTRKNREAMYAFFQKHFNVPGSSADEEVAILTPEEIQVTKTGQVSTSLGGETVYSMNRSQTGRLIQSLETSRKDTQKHFPKVVAAAKMLSGYRTPTLSENPVFTGRTQRDGYAIEKYFLKGEGDYAIPYLLMIPDKMNGTGILYLHPEGKSSEAAEGGEIEELVKGGAVVLAPDLPGIGELGKGDFRGDAFIKGISHNIWYSSILIGRSIVGIQAGDIARLVNVFTQRTGVNHIYGLARKELTPVLLHAAAFLPSIERIALIDPLPSYATLTMNRFYYSGFIPAAVPAALTSYDLPDLAASLAPRELRMVHLSENGTDTSHDDAHKEGTANDMRYIEGVYQATGSKFEVLRDVSGENLSKILIDWMH